MKDVSWLRRPQFTFTHCRLTIRHEDEHDEIGDDDDDCDGDDIYIMMQCLSVCL